MFNHCRSLVHLDLRSMNVGKVKLFDYMFTGCENLRTLDLGGWYTYNAEVMDQLFAGCKRLETLDLSGWRMTGRSAEKMFSKVPKTARVIANDESIIKLLPDGIRVIPCGWHLSEDRHILTIDGELPDWGSWRPAWFRHRRFIEKVVVKQGSRAKTCRSMFDGCVNLKEIDLRELDLSNAHDMTDMFKSCCLVRNVDLGVRNGSVSSISGAFDGCSALREVDLSGWDASSVQSFDRLFAGCEELCAVRCQDEAIRKEVLRLPGAKTSQTDPNAVYFTKSGDGWEFDTETGKLTLTGQLDETPFEEIRDDVRSVEALPGASISNGKQLFAGMSNLAEADLSNLDVSICTDMSTMFYGCTALSSLDLSAWDVSNVLDMGWMFRKCTNLECIQTGPMWDPQNVMNIAYMFEGCTNLRTIGDVLAWSSTSLQSCHSLFESCKSLETVNLCSMDVSKVHNLSSMFEGCSNLRTLDLSDWETYRVTDMRYVFLGCTNLESIDLTGWHIQEDTNTGKMFHQVPQTARVRTDAISVVQRLPEGMPYEYDASGDERRREQVEFCLEKGNGYFYESGFTLYSEYAGDWYEKASVIGMLNENEKASLAWKFEEIGERYLGMVQNYPDNPEYPGKAEEMFAWVEKFGDAEDVYNIAVTYEEAEYLPDHEAKAAKWYEAAAEKGDVDAQFEIGYRYYYGKGVSRNLDQAAKWFEKAASQGLAEAQFAMGVMYDKLPFDEYLEGKGVIRDYKKAAEWYEKAVAQGHAGAMNNLANLYYHADGVHLDRDKAKSLWQKAADLGDEKAKDNLKELF